MDTEVNEADAAAMGGNGSSPRDDGPCGGAEADMPGASARKGGLDQPDAERHAGALDRMRARAAFDEYVSDYDPGDPKIELKIVHTLHVAELCERIAASLGVPSRDVDLAWLSGLLHDIGRFEQVRRYGTFDDRTSCSHAALGVEILFGEDGSRAGAKGAQGGADAPSTAGGAATGRDGGTLGEFVDPSALERDEVAMLRAAIAHHSAYRLPDGLDPRTRTLCCVLRDADKIDILRANIDTPTSAIQDVPEERIRASRVTPGVERGFYEHRTLRREERSTPLDALVSYACFVYELVYPESRRIADEQGFVYRLLARPVDDPQTRQTLARMSDHLRDWLRASY
ncbi:MAG: HD domain-containing protein [Coriobacteriales bacterium]|jgi:putative nucleotidyltransferase with HDIG domain